MHTERAAHTSGLHGFIQRYRNEILAEWRRLARASIDAARDLAPVALGDHIPELLEQIAEIADAVLGNRELPVFDTARRHAIDRLGVGFDVSAVVQELSNLRGCMLAIVDRERVALPLAELRALDLAIDHAIAASVTRYAQARERTLAGIDRISTATLEAASLDELLQRLLRVFKGSTATVDTAAILLLEGDKLRNCATVGLDEEARANFRLSVGEGFAGTVAAKREPMALRSAHTDPLVKSEVIKKLGIRALYGVPLLHDGQLIGVAHMGSLQATEFAPDDRQFFASLAARATVAIVHHMLRQDLAISERRFKQLADERERALAKLESLLAASPVGIAFFDRDLRYLRINDALAEINGHPAADHIGKTVAEMIPQAVDRAVPILQQVLATGQPVLNHEFPVPHPVTGETLALLANYFPVRAANNEITGVGGIIVNVTELARTQAALRTEQARFQAVIDHSPAAIWVKDQAGRILIANKPLAEALGVPRDELIGRRSDEILPVEIAQDHQEHDQRVLDEGRAIEVEEIAPSPLGDRTFLSIKFPIPGDSPMVGAIAAEITDRKRMEQELKIAVKMREDLLSVVSHDLRSPLSAVQLSSTILLGSHGADARARRHLEMIARSCARMESLIDDLLDTALIREGRFQLELEREPAADVVREAVDLQQPLAAEKTIALTLDMDLGNVHLRCDRNRILQVFSNLIGNAIKFCRAGDTIRVTGQRTGPNIQFMVEDSGPGIPAGALARLFEPYWSSPEHVARGAGLGLYIVRGIIESHGGRVWAESDPGHGARFVFTLPIAE